jgi:phosphoglycolate phosphatase-like HAD superfamily hydrolase
VIDRVQQQHRDAYKRNLATVRPLPGARALLAALSDADIPFAHCHEQPHRNGASLARDARL